LKRFRNQWFLLVLALLGLSTLFGIRFYTEYARIEREELLRMEAQVRMIEASVGRQFRAVNQVLENMRTELPRWRSSIDPGISNEGVRSLTTLTEAMLFVRTLLVLDAQGKTILSNRPEIIGQSLAQRDYFRAAAQQPGAQILYVTPPFKSLLGSYTMNLSRMLSDADGKFDGVVAASLDPKEFEIMLDVARYAPDVELHLAHQNNSTFVSAPPRPESHGNTMAALTATQMGLQRSLSLAGLTSDNTMQIQLSRQRGQVFAAWQDRLQAEGLLLVLLAIMSALGLRIYQRHQQQYDDQLAAGAEVLRASEERHRMTVEAITVGVMDIDLANGTVRCDAHWYEMLGFAPDAFPMTLHEWFWRMHPDDATAARTAYQSMLGSVGSLHIEFRFRDYEDGWRWISARGRVVTRDQHQMPVRVIATHLDISARKLALAQLQSSEQRLRTLLSSMQDIVFFIDTSGTFVEYHAPAGRPDYLANGRILTGANYTRDLSPALAERLEAAILGIIRDDLPQQFDFSVTRQIITRDIPDAEGMAPPENAPRHLHVTMSGVKTIATAAFPIGFLGVVRDVTELHEADEQIRIMAFHDPLTRLPNRRLLIDRLIQQLAGCQRSHDHGALMFLDLDRFKALNDTHGHDAGDQLLMEVAQRLQARIRAVDTVARLGGDEFVVMLAALGEDAAAARTEATSIAEQIRLSLQQPYALTTGNDQTPLRWDCSSSIGVRVFGGATETDSAPAASAERVLKEADNAMYAAKTAGRNLVRLAV
jgi:diguanylate cyclase (GGDEF)-like protein